MPAARPSSRRIPPAADRPAEAADSAGDGGPIDPAAIVSAMSDEIARLRGSGRPAAGILADFLPSVFPALIGFAVAKANEQGRNYGEEILISERDRLLRQAYTEFPYPSATQFRRELREYQAIGWQRDRSKPNPYRESEREFLFYKILALIDYVLGETQMRSILHLKGV